MTQLPPGVTVLISEKEIADRLAEMAREIERDHEGQELVLVAVLKGAVMVVADLSRELQLASSLEFMAVSSYGAATSSSGVVRIIKDLDRDISGCHVLLVEDIVDSGLTLSWLLRHLKARRPASLEVAALLRKPEAKRSGVAVRYVGFDIGPEFVIGYGLDFAERFRSLRFVGVYHPEDDIPAAAVPRRPVSSPLAELAEGDEPGRLPVDGTAQAGPPPEAASPAD